MRRKTAGILLGIATCAAAFAGCGSDDAAETASENAQAEQEGAGEGQEGAEPEETEEAAQKADEKKDGEDPAGTVAVLLPDNGREIWKSDGLMLKTHLEEKNYQVSVKFAGDDPSRQISQLEELLENPVSAVILTPVDGYGLTEILPRVKEAGIPVFSYDDLAMDTDALDYYVTFDYRAMGQMAGKDIVEKAELERLSKEEQQVSIEFFMGSVDDTDALFFFNGVMESLQPYFDSGTLVCLSGQKSFEETGTLRWDANAVSSRMKEMLETTYRGGRPDIICTGFDSAAGAVCETLQSGGLSPESENWPLIIGFDCGEKSAEGLEKGWLAGSVYLNRDDLASACVEMLDTVVEGETPEVSDYSQYDNGKKIIATRTCTGTLVDQKNYQEILENEE